VCSPFQPADAPDAERPRNSSWKLSEISRHRSLDTLRDYVRRVDLFHEHAGAAFLQHRLIVILARFCRPPTSAADLGQRGAPQQAIGRTKSLGHLEMVIVLTHQHFDQFAGSTKGGIEITSLALELGCLLCAVG
jgi:hypothetical protein